MKKIIPIIPVPQIGHICKPTAIASIEQHYAPRFGFSPIPLRKEKVKPLSIRQLAKRQGSVQGELLEIQQVQNIFSDLGYKASLVDCRNDYALFRETIIRSLEANNLIVACFAVNRYTGFPSPIYDDNEHAAIINGFDEENDTIRITHWGAERETTFREFYESSYVLPTHRKPEYYENIKQSNAIKKYELAQLQDDLVFYFNPDAKKSIQPKENSGFRCKLLVIKEPSYDDILEARKKLFPKPIPITITTPIPPVMTPAQLNFLSQLSFVAHKATRWALEVKNNPAKRALLEPAIIQANKLYKAIKEGADEFFKGPIDEEGRKQDFNDLCTKAITAARPELEKHRGWKMALGNLVLAIAGLGIGFVIAGLVNLALSNGKDFLFFKQTDSSMKLDILEHEVQMLVAH